jgi:transaldolase
MKVKLMIEKYVDAADLNSIKSFLDHPEVSGFTTNPTLMRKAGIDDYLEFAREVQRMTSPKPLSLEVFSDDPNEIFAQAKTIATLGENIFVKIPVTTTSGQSLKDVMRRLSSEGVQLNVTAVFTVEQVDEICSALEESVPAIVSVFAGRIADSGVEPGPIMERAAEIVHRSPHHKLLWASPREILNLIQAERAHCDIITMTPELWAKVPNIGKPLEQFSLETVKMFYDDATAAGYSL